MTVAFKFDATLEPGQPLNVPGDIRNQIPPGARAQVIMLIEEAKPHDFALGHQESALRKYWDDPSEDIYGAI